MEQTALLPLLCITFHGVAAILKCIPQSEFVLLQQYSRHGVLITAEWFWPEGTKEDLADSLRACLFSATKCCFERIMLEAVM